MKKTTLGIITLAIMLVAGCEFDIPDTSDVSQSLESEPLEEGDNWPDGVQPDFVIDPVVGCDWSKYRSITFGLLDETTSQFPTDPGTEAARRCGWTYIPHAECDPRYRRDSPRPACRDGDSGTHFLCKTVAGNHGAVCSMRFDPFALNWIVGCYGW